MSDVLARLMRWMETSDIDDAGVVLRDAITEIAGLRARLHEHRIAAQRLAELSGARQRGETGQPVLTDAEREAVELATEDCRYHQDPGGRAAYIEATLRGLLERLGVLPDREHPPRKEGATPARSGETGGDSPERE
jgi:hypothetical protein